MKMTKVLLLALIGMLLFSAMFVRAQDEDVPAEDLPAGDEEAAGEVDDSDYVESQRDPNTITGIFSRATFANDFSAPRLPAGEKVTTNVAFSNDAENPAYTVHFVIASLTHVADPNYYIQNFTATRHNRQINGGETHTFRYQFTPDANLDPNDYGLVVRLYFVNDANQTFVTVAYNDTVTITDPLGADPRTFMTFGTIAAIIGGVWYVVVGRKKKAYKPAARKSTVEMGTGASFDPDYVSADHIKFSERKQSSSPNKRSSSNKK